MQHRVTPRIALLLTVPPLLWAGNAVVGRMAAGTVPPVQLNAVRWFLAGLLLLPLAHRVVRERTAFTAERVRYLLLLGVLGMGSYNSLQYLALTTSTPVNVTLIAASMPVWMLLVGIVVYRVHPRRADWLGAVLSLAGVALVLSHGDVSSLARLHLVTGDLLMLIAVFTWSLYSWLLAQPPASMRGEQRPDWDWAAFLFLQIAFGMPWCIFCAGLEMTASNASWHWTPWLIPLLAYVAIGPSVIAYRLWGLGMATVGPSIAAFFSNLTPAFAALMSAALLGEPPRWHHIAAFVLIVAGIVLSSRR